MNESQKVALLKAMDTVMRAVNDESFMEPWLAFGVPDEATEDDYEFIANDYEEMRSCTDMFLRLVRNREFTFYLG